MEFTIRAKQFKEALEQLQVKGRNLTNRGFSSGNFGSSFLAEITGERELVLYNGDATFLVQIKLPITEGTVGRFVGDSNYLLPYLKSFDESVSVHVDEYITLRGSSGDANSRTASVPQLIEHPSQQGLIRLSGMVSHIRYEPAPQTLFHFSNKQYEGAFTLTSNQFQNCIKNCELVKSGIYNLNFVNLVPTFSTRMNRTNNYRETITPVFAIGEPATLDFSSPLYSFFGKEQLLNFYVRDEFPLLIVADDRLLLKAPHVGGN